MNVAGAYHAQSAFAYLGNFAVYLVADASVRYKKNLIVVVPVLRRALRAPEVKRHGIFAYNRIRPVVDNVQPVRIFSLL